MIALLLALLVFGGLLLWWLFVETEGAYLGRRVVVALYDLYAGRYDRIKQFDEQADFLLVSQPLMDSIAPQRDPLILDVATGTGRLPLLLARNARFTGHVIGLDASRRMLGRARQKVAAENFAGFISLCQRDASALPFPDSNFDVVTCLEALEFLPQPRAALAEMARVLRPGGLLLCSLRIDTRWMPGRVWSEADMRATLEKLNLHEIRFAIWQEDYSQVWAWKRGQSPPTGRRQLQAALGHCLLPDEGLLLESEAMFSRLKDAGS